MTKWDKRFLGIAEHISKFSVDPSTQVGAVIADKNNRIISIGYNGFARGIEDSAERLNDRDTKLKLMIHAEMNCVLFANRSLKDCTIYTFPMQPCAQCSSVLIQSGIKKCVSVINNNERWQESFKLSRQILKEAGVGLLLYDDYLEISNDNNVKSNNSKCFHSIDQRNRQCIKCGKSERQIVQERMGQNE